MQSPICIAFIPNNPPYLHCFVLRSVNRCLCSFH